MSRRWFIGIPIILLVAGGFASSDAYKGDTPLRRATFEVRHELKVMVPEGAKRVRIWFALPQDDPIPGEGAAQQVSDLRIDSPYPYRVERDSEGSKLIYIEAQNPREKEFTVVENFVLTRSEVRMDIDPKKARPLTEAERAAMAAYLGSNKNVVIDDEIRQLANKITEGETNPVIAAKKLYDWTLDNIDYWVKDPKNKKASPVGSSTYCLKLRTGNCTDFESLWTALARGAGIPTRIVYGSFFKPEFRGKDADQSYHCWATFYAPGLGWLPHDVGVADLYHGEFEVTADNEALIRRTAADGTFGPDPVKANYYFGNLDERRMVWTIGRDLMLRPSQDGGPVNALPKAYIEIDGKEHPEGTGWKRLLTYRERT